MKTEMYHLIDYNTTIFVVFAFRTRAGL